MQPESGQVWTVRFFRQPEERLKVMKIIQFLGLSVAFIDMDDPKWEDGRDKIVWYSRPDLQFYDYLYGQTDKKVAANEEGSDKEEGPRVEVAGRRGPNPPARGRQ